jgi:hypothetical protein
VEREEQERRRKKKEDKEERRKKEQKQEGGTPSKVPKMELKQEPISQDTAKSRPTGLQVPSIKTSITYKFYSRWGHFS